MDDPMTTGAPSRCQDQARALWYVAPGAARIETAPLPARGPDMVRVDTLWSALSRGTERLVLAGLTAAHGARMRAPLQEGSFPFPVKYGYCAVGRVSAGDGDVIGRTVFVLAPHQDVLVVPAGAVVPVPEGVPARRATLAANMETALNALWDAGAGPGDRIVVVGAGLVGLLVAALAARMPGTTVTAIDPDPARGAVAAGLGVRHATGADGSAEADVVFHASATAAGLATALACCGTEARLVEMSWYGDREIDVRLGGTFHSRRITLVSSQVGMVAPSRRPRWSHRRRLETALALLADPRLDLLITEEVPFTALPAALPRLLGPGAAGIATVVRYDRDPR